MNIRKGLAVAGTALAVATSILGFSSPASAAARDGDCDSGEFCYYYNSNQEGSVSDFAASENDYGASQPECFEFKGEGNGKGVCVKNNAASVWNRTDKTVRVYFNSNFGGASQDFAAGAKGNLNSTLKNNNASHEFGPGARTDLSDALYKANGGRITAGFDGYETTPGRHEGIDFARSIGSDVYALVSGRVTNVVHGSTGSGGLSTIAIYNASLNKTVIYLHTAPKAGVSRGDTISRGELIADESWRGVGSSSAAHTHVEVRNGEQTHASKSVGDPVLDNPDPSAFWRSQGYNER
ncbi:peptidase inhibitor family I36 protein [Actinoplanes sp. NEAU-A12]|uniref:Peptidase inhibitor family I36 protein n=1 Tax=Actinoplanes sandaracinus TaxID=3045177 RepID=A0ABT6WCM0_9ACTN|nr:peptidase inhibitor family I36 protein [Actinoplanes sandaracinus]MDI6097480.1 peptidase inhibitor family I36 protein [Actinoplanes sandaracinus]